MADDQPLDPDQRTCPRCQAEPGHVCRQPNGSKAPRIHAARRADQSVQSSTVNNATRAGRSKGGKRAAQERRRRRAETSAKMEERRAKAEADAIEAEAARLADDAVAYAKRRAKVRSDQLDVAEETGARLLEAVRNLHRPVGFDTFGKPDTVAVEQFRMDHGKRVPVYDPEGNKVTEEVPDLIGWHTVDQVKKLAEAYASVVNTLRLEEGKPTGITETTTGGAAAALGDVESAELVEWARKNLTGGGTP